MNMQLDTSEVRVAVTEYLRKRGVVVEDPQQVLIGIIKTASGERIDIVGCSPSVVATNVKLPEGPLPMSAATTHMCQTAGRSNCTPCMRFEADLWEAINRYAGTVGGDPSNYVHGNVPRMQAVADVGRIVEQKTADLERDLAHLRRLYAESRDYVRALEGERDALIEAGRQDVAEIDRLDVVVGKLRACLTSVRSFLRGVAGRPELGSGAKDLTDEAEIVSIVLLEVAEKGSVTP